MSEDDADKFFAKRHDYSSITVPFLKDGKVETVHIEKKLVGTYIRGHVGAHNAARLPWKWEGITWRSMLRLKFRHREMSHGEWFFNPAKVIQGHLGLDEKEFGTVYVSHPYVALPDAPKQSGN